MSSRFYRSYKFIYTDDLERNSLKRHRSYLDSNGTEITPTTQLFLDRVVDIPEKVTGTSRGLRHILAQVGQSKLKAKIPYAPGNLLAISHVREILATERVECGEYYGERIISNGRTNRF